VTVVIGEIEIETDCMKRFFVVVRCAVKEGSFYYCKYCPASEKRIASLRLVWRRRGGRAAGVDTFSDGNSRTP
jgi:hypothetical protein